MTNPDPLLTLDQAAEYLGGVSARTVRRLIARTELRGTYVANKAPFVRRSELERYLNRRTANPQ